MTNDALPPVTAGGDRVQFATGAERGATVAGEGGKFPLRYDLLLANTTACRRVAEAFGEGAQKYSDNNWKKGMPESVIINHCIAHLVQHLEGDTTEDHLGHATWNLMALMWMQENKPEQMDLTK